MRLSLVNIMVNVNAHHKEGFNLFIYGNIRERPLCASSKWKIVYAGLNADCLRKYDAACVFHCINQDIFTTKCANKFE